MKFINLFYSLFFTLILISCSIFDDSLRLPGEKSKDIIYFELDNDYLAPESREYIELNYSSNNINKSFVLIGKNTYGFEADLNNDMSLSFDEDGSIRKTREHPFLKENYKEGKLNKEGRKKDEDEKDRDKDDKDDGKGKEVEKCFELIMPFTLIMPDGSTITIEKDEDRRKVDDWYKNNPDEKDRPKHQFPLDVIIINEEGNEEEITLEKDEELKELLNECENLLKETEKCFDVIMPFSLELPDGSIVTIEDDEDNKQIDEWYDNNPDSKERPKFLFPIEISIDKKTEEGIENEIITINNREELERVMLRCKDNKGKKDRCKKLRGDEIPDCITEYISSNFSNDEIIHSRMLKTKGGEIFYIVKLKENGILKFDEDCEFLD